ncbi:antibiotic biosynthesis monooxygenase family protein [Rhodopseudomonas pseudopalustris]|uniref:Quinol monooxygenase YgiN n=1 Tax=Rhodopseudomonas pseudopalustris TaxID=1513892 RepID=A0A1H8LYI7_9BRAD|nr:hypothetical protein [Rhodopseudomonas pseudopalustris]SEO10183.1 hypothetical protein SAMN05444123_101281 [Rhodopseudomonas pseudopalustris]
METHQAHAIHLKLRCRGPDGQDLIDYLREAAPFYQELPGVTIRLLRNVERPGEFVEIVEYATREAFDADQIRIAEDQQMLKLLGRWRALLTEPPVVEHYEDISTSIG